MKKWLLSTLALAVVATVAQAAQTDQSKQPYAKLKKQIGIMGNIIESSLDEGKGRRRSSVKVEGVYLKSQGIVFEVSSGRGFSHLFRQQGHDFDFDFQVAPIDPIEPIAPIEPMVFSGEFDEDFEENVETVVKRSMAVYEDAMNSMRERSEYARELRDEQRELAHEMRNYARRQRDLEFEARHAEKERAKELKEQLTMLKKESVKMKQKNDELKLRAKKEEQSLKQKRSKRAEQVKQARQQYYLKLENSIVETLCDYGAGLRQLAKNEQVTFIVDMSHAKRGEAIDNVKKIYSFNKKDIISCVMEDKTPAALLKAGNPYYF